MVVGLNKKVFNVLFSVILLAIITSIIMFVFYPSDGKLGQSFGVVAMFLLSRYLGLFIGAGLLLLRIIRVLKDNSALIYIFAGVLNTCLGVLSLVLFISNNMVSSGLALFILNEFIGAIILIDIMILDSK